MTHTVDGRKSANLVLRRRSAVLRLEHLFLATALTWGVIQVFIVPPLQVPDEGDHFFRAWAIADGQLTADRQGMVTIPGSLGTAAALYTSLVGSMNALPVTLDGQPTFRSYEDLFNGHAATTPVRVISRVASYGPTGYMPQAVGIALGQAGGLPPLTSFYLARLANLIVAVALVFLAIRLAPFAKQLYLLLGLLPMTMYEFASVSVDAMTIAGAMFFVALVMHASHRERIRPGLAIGILATAAVLLNVKPGYWALVLLLLMLRPSQVGGRSRYVAFVGAAFLLVSAVALTLYLGTATDARGAATIGGPMAQVQFIVTQPLAFLEILGASLQRYGVVWALESIGTLGWLNVWLPFALYVFVVVVGIGLFLRMAEPVVLHRWQRALLAGVGVAVFLTMAVALYAFLEPVGSGGIFFQGRYLAPVWLVLLLSTYGIRFAPRRLGTVFVTAALVVIMVESLATVVRAYH
jgi:uncharacterized membrane protein